MAQSYEAQLLNLERIVPGEMWGSYTADDIDFMHFKGPGHRLVAEALLPYVRKILEARRN
jgi:lysophospholipase L1-like esterase